LCSRSHHAVRVLRALLRRHQLGRDWGEFSFANFHTVVFETSFSSALSNTFILGMATATLVAAFTTLSAWLAVRRQPEHGCSISWRARRCVFPAIVLAVAFLQFVLNVPFALYGTLLVDHSASMVQFMPFGMRYSMPASCDPSQSWRRRRRCRGARPDHVSSASSSVWCCPRRDLLLFIFRWCRRRFRFPRCLPDPRRNRCRHDVRDVQNRGGAGTCGALGIIWDDDHDDGEHAFFVLSRRYGLSAR
jgi:hypothetical protein